MFCLQVWPGWWFQEPGLMSHWERWTSRAGDCLWCSAPFPASPQPSSSSCWCLRAPSSSWRYLKARLVLMFVCSLLLFFTSELSLRFLSHLCQAGCEKEAIRVFQLMFKLNTWGKGKNLPVWTKLYSYMPDSWSLFDGKKRNVLSLIRQWKTIEQKYCTKKNEIVQKVKSKGKWYL